MDQSQVQNPLPQQNPSAPEAKGHGVWMWVGVAVLVVIVLAAIWWFVMANRPELRLQEGLPSDQTNAIQSDLDAVNVAEVDAELQAIDEDLKQL